jgi:transposase
MARSRTLPWFQVQRARAVLAIADGERVQTVAFQMQCYPSTVWRLCRRYEEAGLEGVLAEVPRTGHPIEISPLQRAQIVQLACLEPIAKGLHITHCAPG